MPKDLESDVDERALAALNKTYFPEDKKKILREKFDGDRSIDDGHIEDVDHYDAP